jgi:hypothetical protein
MFKKLKKKPAGQEEKNSVGIIKKHHESIGIHFRYGEKENQ